MTQRRCNTIAFLFFGLLFFAASTSFAQTFAGSNTGVTIETAAEYMKRKSTIPADAFIDDNNLADFIDCGTSKCNINTHVCMTQEDGKVRSTLRSIGNTATHYLTRMATGAAIGSAVGGIGGGTAIGSAAGAIEAASVDGYIKSVATRYKCVPKSQEATEAARGWVKTETGGTRTVTHTNAYGTRNQTTKSKIKDEICYNAKESSGAVKYYCIKYIGTEVQVISGDEDKQGCEVVPVRWNNNRKCLFCSLTGIIYAAAEKLTVLSYIKLASSFAIVLTLGLGLWVAMKTLLFVSAMTKQDAAKYLTETLAQGFKFVIAYFALIYYDEIFTYIIYPLLRTGIAFGTSFVQVETLASRFGDIIAGYINSNNSEALLQAYAQDPTQFPAGYSQNFANIYFNISTYAVLENLAYNINLNYSLLQTIGSTLWCVGSRYMALLYGASFENFGLGFACMIYGACFCIMGFLLSLAFVFYILDAIVQLGIVGALLPFLVACWPFKITSKYTSAGFKIFLNSIFTFMMMGLVARVGMELISVAISINTEGGATGDSAIAALVEALDTIDTEKLKKMVNVWSVGFLVFVFANFMGFMMVNKVKSLTDQFAGGGLKPAAPSIATMGASSVKGAVSKVTAPTRKAVGDWADKKIEQGAAYVGRKIVSAATLRPLRNAIKSGLNKPTSAQSPDQTVEDSTTPSTSSENRQNLRKGRGRNKGRNHQLQNTSRSERSAKKKARRTANRSRAQNRPPKRHKPKR